jgi:hypothetical protein
MSEHERRSAPVMDVFNVSKAAIRVDVEHEWHYRGHIRAGAMRHNVLAASTDRGSRHPMDYASAVPVAGGPGRLARRLSKVGISTKSTSMISSRCGTGRVVSPGYDNEKFDAIFGTAPNRMKGIASAIVPRFD